MRKDVMLTCNLHETNVLMPMRPALHFAHANSYPAGCYRKLLSRLEGLAG